MRVADGIVERVKGPDGEIVEVIVKAPIAEMKIAAAELNQPPPSDKEVAEVAMAVAQEEHDAAALAKLSGETMCNLLVSLVLMHARGESLRIRTRGVDGYEILVPRAIIDAAEGATVGITETADHDVILRCRTRGESRITPEEMRDV